MAEKIDWEKEYRDLAYKFSCVVDNATGGRLSKTTYPKELYYDEIQENYRRWFEEDCKEEKAELEAENLRLQAQVAELQGALEAILPHTQSEADMLDDASVNDGRASAWGVASMKVRRALASDGGKLLEVAKKGKNLKEQLFERFWNSIYPLIDSYAADAAIEFLDALKEWRGEE